MKAFVRRGAKKTVDYNDPEWPGQVRDWAGEGVDTALAIQPGTGSPSIKAVKNEGLLITVSGDSHTVAPERNITIRQMAHSQGAKDKIKLLLDQIAAGTIKLTIENEYPFLEALDAVKKTETRQARGKVVVTI